MSRTYKATGINLKSMPMGEADRLLTILTREFGLVRAMAMGARKHNSRMAGRSEPFVVNQLLIAKGRSLDKVTQAETLESYPGLAQNLPKLIASQYLAELTLYQALSDQPQEELFCLLNEHLGRIEGSSPDQTLARLTHAVFQLLVLAGLAPQVHLCGVSRQVIQPDLSDSNWRCGFSIPLGGTVTEAALEQLIAQNRPVLKPKSSSRPGATNFLDAEGGLKPIPGPAIAVTSSSRRSGPTGYGNLRLAAPEIIILQRLAEPELTADLFQKNLERIWHSVERVLRQYAEYHLDHVVRSAALIDTCFNPADPSLPV